MIYEINGPEGGLSYSLTFPGGSQSADRKYTLAIIMHGFSSSRRMSPVTELAAALGNCGLATLCFDFEAHGESEGDFSEMTISKELEDAKAVFDYASGLPFVKDIILVGHSQGGLVAGMLAGELEKDAHRPSCLILLAPAASIKYDVIAGHYLNARFNPSNPPESINVLSKQLSRNFIIDAQNLPVYEVSSQYSGKVCIIHGDKDFIVPLSFSQKYQKEYSDCNLVVIPQENHNFSLKPELLTEAVQSFVRSVIL